MDLKLIKTDLLSTYLAEVPKLSGAFESLKDADISTESFSFYTSVSSVFSSKIEGEQIELDSYVKYKRFGIEFEPNYTRKTDDLYNAYAFAKDKHLNKKNIETAHQLLSKNLVEKSKQGKLRIHDMYVTTSEGRIEYVAISPYALEQEMQKWYHDLETLLEQRLSIEEVFYFASYLHLSFVKIHPWNDGNGRSGRLIEKWFMAQHLGHKAWFIQSEKNYYTHHHAYYANLRKLGLEYPDLDYTKALPFLLMLPQTLVFGTEL